MSSPQTHSHVIGSLRHVLAIALTTSGSHSLYARSQCNWSPMWGSPILYHPTSYESHRLDYTSFDVWNTRTIAIGHKSTPYRHWCLNRTTVRWGRLLGYAKKAEYRRSRVSLCVLDMQVSLYYMVHLAHIIFTPAGNIRWKPRESYLCRLMRLPLWLGCLSLAA